MSELILHQYDDSTFSEKVRVLGLDEASQGRGIGIITGLFERKSEYRIRSVACLFYERVEPYDQ
jgi:hypothetical protein